MDLTPEGQNDLDEEVARTIEIDIPKLKDDIADLKAIVGQDGPKQTAGLKRTLALVPITDLDDMIDVLFGYQDLLEGIPPNEPRTRKSEMGRARGLIVKVRGHIAG